MITMQEVFNMRHASRLRAIHFRMKYPIHSRWRYDLDKVTTNLNLSLSRKTRSLRAIELSELLFPQTNHVAFAAELLAPIELVQILACAKVKTGEVSFFGFDKKRSLSVKEILSLFDIDEFLLKYQTTLLRQM